MYCTSFVFETAFHFFFVAALFSDVESIQALGLQVDLLAQGIGPVGHRTKFISKIGKFITMQKGQEIAVRDFGISLYLN